MSLSRKRLIDNQTANQIEIPAELLPSAETVTRIRELLVKARHQALQAVNSAMVAADAKSYRKNNAAKRAVGTARNSSRP